MKLYLSSYKLGNNEEELKNWIKQNGSEIILIPNSRDVFEESERKRNGIDKDIEMLERVGFNVKEVSLINYFDNYIKLKKDFEPYRAFFAIGGNTFALRKAMQLSGFDKFLKEISSKENYLYAGYSAGICVLANNLRGLELVDEPINPYNKDEISYEGIGLIDYLPIPHYKSNHPESELVEDAVIYCKENGLKYKTLSDGDVILTTISELDIER